MGIACTQTTYSSILRVLRDARDISVYLCGTARTNFGFPRPISKDVVKDLSKGEYTWRMSDDGITAILWHDTVPTQFLSNFHNPEEESSVYSSYERTEGTTSPFSAAGGGRLQQVHGWRKTS